MRNLGLSPKPVFVKTKSINRLDLFLPVGAKAEDLSKIGYFKDLKPVFHPDSIAHLEQQRIIHDLNDQQMDAIKSRWNDRVWEQGEYGPDLEKYANRKTVSLDGTFVNDMRPKLADGSDNNGIGQPFAGDIDVFSICDPRTGKPVDLGREKQIIQRLMRLADRDVEHGMHVSTSWDGPGKDIINQGHLSNVFGGRGEPLVQFGSTGQVKTSSYYREWDDFITSMYNED